MSRESELKREYPDRVQFTKSDLIACLILFAAATVLMFPIFARGFPNGDDALMHYRRTADFIEAMREGSLYPRWLPRSNFGQGSPVTLYYPPLPFYVVGAFNTVARDPLLSLSLSCWLALALSGLTMYVFSRSLLSRRISLLVALLYMTAPYHVFDLYHRSAIWEFWSFTWLPLVLHAAYRVVSRGDLISITYLAGSYALSLLSHMTISFEIALILPIYLVLLTRSLRRIAQVAVGLGLAAVISAVFLVPLLLEIGYVRFDRALRVSYAKFFLFEDLRGMFNTHFFPPPEQRHLYYGDGVNLIALSLVLLFMVSALILWRRRRLIQLSVSGSRLVLPVLVIAALTLLLTTRLTAPIWRLVPKFEYIQYPFRWLVIATAVVILLAGVAASALARGGGSVIFYRVALSALVVAQLAISALAIGRATYDRNFLEGGLTGSEVAEYRTMWLDRQKHLDETEKPAVTVSSGDAGIRIIDDSGSRQSYIVTASTLSTLTLRTYYFPGWVARVDGQSVEIAPSKEGNIQLAIEPGEHNLTLSFEDTRPRRVGRFISVAGLLVFLITACLGIFTRRRGPG